jgi:hypothetical protein
MNDRRERAVVQAFTRFGRQLLDQDPATRIVRTS